MSILFNKQKDNKNKQQNLNKKVCKFKQKAKIRSIFQDV